jgi:Domain of unknown function (DUF4365)
MLNHPKIVVMSKINGSLTQKLLYFCIQEYQFWEWSKKVFSNLLNYLLIETFMDRNTHKEEFSYAYVHAIAAVAGYDCAISKRPLDNDGIDITITALGIQGIRKRPRIELQVKCSSRMDIVHEDYIKYPLEVSAYNNLRFDDPTIPCLLIVVLVPDEIEEWIDISESELLIRKCGYWISLAGEPETDNTKCITISIPRVNLFKPDTLKNLIHNIGAGG